MITKKENSMFTTQSCVEISTCFTYLVMLARRHDLAAIVKIKDKFSVAYSARIDLKVVDELKEYDVYHLITHGKTTKSKLTAEEKDLLLVYIRECNVQLN